MLEPSTINWYESGLPLLERKQRGHFSTPPFLVHLILDACGYTSAADLSELHVLDPACGSGNFLAGVTERLCAFAARQHLSPRETARLLERHLWGFDPDPVSCFLAEMQVRSIAAQTTDVPQCLHIHQADSLTLAWEEPCIDLFLANPPYLAAKNTDLSGYRSTRRRGQTDSYLLFLELALAVVRPGGWLGLVVPDPVLARANASFERRRLLQVCTLQHLWHLSNVFSADVGAVVIIARKDPPPRAHQVNWARQRWRSIPPQAPLQEQPIAQALFLAQPGAELRYLLNTEEGAFCEQLRRALADTSRAHIAPLSNFLTIKRGEEIGRESVHLTLHEYKAEASTVSPDAPPHSTQADAWLPVLRGGVDIQPYAEPRTNWRIARIAIKKPHARYTIAKLLVVKSTDHLQASLDLNGHVVLQTLYLLTPHEPAMDSADLYFFLALLNSRLLGQYVRLLHTAYKWVQPQIEQAVLAHLPIPTASEEQKREIIGRSRLLMLACSQQDPVVELKEYISALYEEQEHAIRVLYTQALAHSSSEQAKHIFTRT